MQRVTEQKRWKWILGSLLMACALENAVAGSREDTLPYRIIQEVLLAPFVALVIYWPLWFLLSVVTQRRRVALTWVFWVFVVLATLGIIAFPFSRIGDSRTNIESIVAIAAAWASSALLVRTRNTAEGMSSAMNSPVAPQKRVTALTVVFALLSAAGFLGSAVSFRGAGSDLSIAVSALAGGVSAGAVAAGLGRQRRWAYPCFLVWIGSTLIGAAFFATTARMELEKVGAFVLVWSLVVLLLGRAVRSRTRVVK